MLYQGRHGQALLLGRQANAAARFEKKRFIGFYSFSPIVIARVRRDLDDALAGRGANLREFERLLVIDQAAKRLKAEFDREHKAVEGALRKLQIAAGGYQPRQFASDLAKCLDRLHRLRSRLPDLIGDAGLQTAA